MRSERVARGWRYLTGDTRAFVEKPLPTADLTHLMEQASVPSFGFYFMLALAAGIASFGLLANSAAAIIGAMIIAPLMAPIMSLAYGIVVTNWRLIVRSVLTVVTGTALVVTFAFVCTEVLGLRVAGSEILGRTSPTLIDLGVALAAGAAAAFAYTRRSIMASIAGVAIAVALVPPLAVTGIGLALGRDVGAEVGLSLSEVGLYSGATDIAGGSFVLFLTNLAGIVVIAATVFATQGYGNWRKAALGVVVAAACSAILIQPLGVSFHKLYVKSTVLGLLGTLSVERPEIFTGEGRVESINVNYRGDRLHLDVDVAGPKEAVSEMQLRIDLLARYLSEAVGYPVVLQIEFIPIEILTFRSEAGLVPEAGK
ncbi:MAG: DUF389 domain-containing protein [Pseudomonadota bacterium]